MKYRRKHRGVGAKASQTEKREIERQREDCRSHPHQFSPSTAEESASYTENII